MCFMPYSLKFGYCGNAFLFILYVYVRFLRYSFAGLRRLLNIHGLQATETDGGGGRRNDRCDEWEITHGSHVARVISVTCERF